MEIFGNGEHGGAGGGVDLLAPLAFLPSMSLRQLSAWWKKQSWQYPH